MAYTVYTVYYTAYTTSKFVEMNRSLSNRVYVMRRIIEISRQNYLKLQFEFIHQARTENALRSGRK